MKRIPRSNSSGQILVIVIIVLVLCVIGYWWLYSNKQTMAREGQAFGKEAVQRIVQRDVNYFGSHLSPEARMQFPPSAQQDLMTRIEKLGTPVGNVDVQGDIAFQSQFFEPHGNFHARIQYPTRGAEINVAISHPVGRWQIDTVDFLAEPER